MTTIVRVFTVFVWEIKFEKRSRLLNHRNLTQSGSCRFYHYPPPELEGFEGATYRLGGGLTLQALPASSIVSHASLTSHHHYLCQIPQTTQAYLIFVISLGRHQILMPQKWAPKSAYISAKKTFFIWFLVLVYLIV